jgi:uncharacterized repeat protein (TIGR01451 family)
MAMFVRLFCVLLALTLLTEGAWANDAFPGTVLSGSNGSVTGTTVGMTGQTGEPAGIGGGSINSFWYSWTAPSAGTARFATCNLTSETTTNHDTTLGVYTGTAVNALTVVASNDDTTGCNSTANANYGSWVEFAVTSGTTYRIRSEGYGSATGTFVLRWGINAVQVSTTDASATEGADTAAFTVAPLSPPQGSAAMTIVIGASPQCSFAPTTLTFTAANFTTPQTVTVTAINDAVAEGTHSCAPAAITTTNYGGVTGAAPSFTVFDNDNPSFTITKTASAASISAPGTITYTITVDNNGSAVLTAPTLTDALQFNGSPIALTTGPTLVSGDVNANNILEDTETWVYSATRAVSQSNIDAGGAFSNIATFDTAQTAPQSSSVAVTTITQSPAMTLDKSYAFTLDANGNSLADVGDTIAYTYLVVNTGNITINNVSISDVHGGQGSLSAISPATVASLAPGASATFTSNYVTVQGDIDNP